MSAIDTRPALLVGVGIAASAAPGVDPVGQALEAEELGFDFVSVSDHPVGTQPTFETATLLTWIAARTTRIAVASRVFAVPFRRPAMLAKQAESLHRLAGGRLILGLGGGYLDDEIAALGGPRLTARQKVDGLADAILIARQAWSGRPVSHSGPVHSLDGLVISPPAGAPIPIWLGTYGPRALAVTGRLADGWIPSFGAASPAQIPAMLERIRGAAHEADRAPDDIRAVYNVPVRVSPRARADDEVVAGTVGDVVEQLDEFTALGFTGFNLMLDSPHDLALVGGELLPALRAAG